MHKSNMHKCNMHKCNMHKCNMHKCNMRKCNMHKCNMHKCNMRKCNMRKCNMHKCNMRKCNMRNCNMHTHAHAHTYAYANKHSHERNKYACTVLTRCPPAHPPPGPLHRCQDALPRDQGPGSSASGPCAPQAMGAPSVQRSLEQGGEQEKGRGRVRERRDGILYIQHTVCSIVLLMVTCDSLRVTCDPPVPLRTGRA